MRGPVTARCQVLGESGGSSFAVPVAVREGQRRPCLVPRGACGLGKGRVLTEVRRRCLRGFIARPWVLLWLVGFLVVCRDPGSTWPSGEPASVWAGPARVMPPGFSLVGRPVKPQVTVVSKPS